MERSFNELYEDIKQPKCAENLLIIIVLDKNKILIFQILNMYSCGADGGKHVSKC